jgi:hypothetical protein
MNILPLASIILSYFNARNICQSYYFVLALNLILHLIVQLFYFSLVFLKSCYFFSLSLFLFPYVPDVLKIYFLWNNVALVLSKMYLSFAFCYMVFEIVYFTFQTLKNKTELKKMKFGEDVLKFMLLMLIPLFTTFSLTILFYIFVFDVVTCLAIRVYKNKM